MAARAVPYYAGYDSSYSYDDLWNLKYNGNPPLWFRLKYYTINIVASIMLIPLAPICLVLWLCL